jgi:hypothetical protein
MPNRFFTAFFAAAVVALAAIAPIASASTRALACQESPAYWISVTDEQGVPGLELVGATTCTAAVDTSDLCASQRSPYPGWVQVTDEIGVPTLYKSGFEPATSTPCAETSAAAVDGRRLDGGPEPAVQPAAAAEVALRGLDRRLRRAGSAEPRGDLGIPLDRHSWERESPPPCGLSALRMPPR